MITPDNLAEAQLQQELREMFLLDTQQQLETYFDIIQRLTPARWIGDIQTIYRAIHTIKGGAVTVDANSMLYGAMVLEDLLSDLRYLEVAPPLNDGKLSQILMEAGELLASCLEISTTSVEDGNRVQLTVGRLQTLHAQVKAQYLPDWNEIKQVHHEFAEQGFDLVILDLEMELKNLPDCGRVPSNIVEIARDTIAQLAQIGVEIELAADWMVLIHRCEELIDHPDSQLWRALWLTCFEILKACVKNSGEIIPTDLDRLDALATAAKILPSAEFSPDISVDLAPSLAAVSIEDDRDLPDLFDSFFEEDILSFDETTPASIELDPPLQSDSIIPVVEILPVAISIADLDYLATSDLFDDSFLDWEISPVIETTLDSILPAPIADISIDAKSLEDDRDLPDLFDSFFEEDILSFDETTPASIELDPPLQSDSIIPVVKILPVAIAVADLDYLATSDLFDDSFLDGEISPVIETTLDSILPAPIADISIDAKSLEDDRDLPDLFDSFFEEDILSFDETTPASIELDPPLQSDSIIPVVEIHPVAIAVADLDYLATSDLFDDSFLDGETLPSSKTSLESIDSNDVTTAKNIPLAAKNSAIETEDDPGLSDFLDDFFYDEDISSNAVNTDGVGAADDRQNRAASESEYILDLFSSYAGEDVDDFRELDELELIKLIEDDFSATTQPVEIERAISATPSAQTSPQPVAIIPVEAKRGISIPVPLERLDRSAQQLVDTLLTARAVSSVSTRLNTQLSQLSLLTQESSHFVTRLRQLQDNYAMLRNISDDRESNGNVTTERYRQGYTTIVRLLENILRMSELGQEIETATYQNNHHLADLDRNILRLKDGIETSRLVPFRNLTLRAKAILRDLSNRYGKPAELIVQNEQVELDAGILQQLEPALLHLLRNAYDHGLETTTKRLAAGKPAQGMISVSLNRRGNLYRLEIEDDGGGIDAKIIYQIAKSKGFPIVSTISKPEQLTNNELLAILCQPGFSSSSSVSEVSGRGVGMDVVATQIATIGGRLNLHTSLGHGTKFTIEVPAPQLLVPCVLFQVGDRVVAFPTEEVLETALLNSVAARMSADDEVRMCAWTLTNSQGKDVSGFDLANYWQFAHRSLPDTAICIRTRQGNDGAEIWSIADDFLEQAELLINPLPSPLISPVGLLGVSLQSDGRLISILDPIALTARLSTNIDRDREYSSTTLAIEQVKPSAPTILIVDDAALIRRRLESSLNTHGFITHTCNDGLEALNWLLSNPAPDLMITDVEMPNMDGFTLIDRARQANIDIPILVVSSRLSEEWGKEARRLGATDYLNKGFSTSELLQKVNSLLGLLVEA